MAGPRRVDLLITKSRQSTDNLDFTADSGIQDEEFLTYFNDAQEEAQSLIANKFTDRFVAERLIDTTSGTEGYPIPDDAFMDSRILHLEYSADGSTNKFYYIQRGDRRERLSGQIRNVPSFYVIRGSQILLQPIPQQTGRIRVTYQKAIPRLDTRRATVSAVTLGADSITSLTLDTSVVLDSDALEEEGYITVVDKDGVVQMRRIPVDSVNSSTGVVTVSSGFTFDSGETIASGDYVLRGRESTTHSQLPVIAESFLLEYVNTRINIRDSSNDANAIAAVMGKFEARLDRSFSEPEGTVTYVPVVDDQYIFFED